MDYQTFSYLLSLQEKPEGSALLMLSRHIFQFKLDDPISEKIYAARALEVIVAIHDERHDEYFIHRPNDGLQWYLNIVNTPFFAQRLDFTDGVTKAKWVPSLDKLGGEFPGIRDRDPNSGELIPLNGPLKMHWGYSWQGFLSALFDYAYKEIGNDAFLPNAEQYQLHKR